MKLKTPMRIAAAFFVPAALLAALAGCQSGESAAPAASFFAGSSPGAQSEGPLPESAAPATSAPGAAVPSASAPAKGASSAAQGLRLVVPEGYTLARIGMTLEEAGVCTTDEFIAAGQNGDYAGYPLAGARPGGEAICYSLEGYLFPATYNLARDAAPQEIIRMMLAAAESYITEELRAQIAQSGYSVHQILTLASIIEKESFGAEVMPTVSSVFHNRLKSGMKLQSDPTITYVEGAVKPFIEGDINRYNEYYNTYKCPALPAGPICSPGLAAIKAAVSPAETDYLFFITDSAGGYHFTADYNQHLANCERYL